MERQEDVGNSSHPRKDTPHALSGKFPPQEYEQRFAQLRTLMADSALDAVLVTNHQNVNYFGGVTSILAGLPGAYGNVRPLMVLLPLKSDPVVIVQFTDHGNAAANSWIHDVRSWIDLPFNTDLLESVLKEKNLQKSRIGMEFSRELHLCIPYNDFQHLKSKLPDIHFVDAADQIWQLRMVKSPAEIERIRTAARITARALRENLALAEEGMTEREISRSIALSLLKYGADKVNYVSSLAGDGTYDRFCQLPTDRKVRKGELLWCDLSAIYRDYCSDMSSFVVVGGPTSEHMKLYDLAKSVHMKAIEYMRPGLTASDVMAFVRKAYVDAGQDWNFNIGRCGHGVGLELGEQPSLDANSKVVLQPGMTLAFEPAILTEKGVFDMEEDVVITEDGCEVLAEVWPRFPSNQ
jgi:Xaa-Pro dipeptidase